MKKKNKKISLNFSVGDMVVYPSHGVGQIDSIETVPSIATRAFS